QASTRGGRPVDRVIAGKVSFKETTGQVGQVLGTIASEGSLISAATGGGGGQALGALAAVGAISSLIYANVKPRADVRYWANLPETIHATSVHQAVLPGSVQARMLDRQGAPVPLDKLIF